jgi:hypothetical protein
MGAVSKGSSSSLNWVSYRHDVLFTVLAGRTGPRTADNSELTDGKVPGRDSHACFGQLKLRLWIGSHGNDGDGDDDSNCNSVKILVIYLRVHWTVQKPITKQARAERRTKKTHVHKTKHGKVYHLDNNHSNQSNNNRNNKFDSLFIYMLNSNSQKPITEINKQKREI